MSLIFDVCLTLQGIDCWEWLSQIHDFNKFRASLCLIAPSLLLPYKGRLSLIRIKADGLGGIEQFEVVACDRLHAGTLSGNPGRINAGHAHQLIPDTGRVPLTAARGADAQPVEVAGDLP
jgi:hypothetical protein